MKMHRQKKAFSISVLVRIKKAASSAYGRQVECLQVGGRTLMEREVVTYPYITFGGRWGQFLLSYQDTSLKFLM